MKSLFLTVGLGDDDFHRAAIRLKSQVNALNIFDSVIVVNEKNVTEICPWLQNWYPDRDLSQTKGYGYFAWKPAVINAAIEGRWGSFDHVVYMDSGCEILPGFRTSRIIKSLIKRAANTGCVAFAIETPELLYSKAKVVSMFPPLSIKHLQNQIQTGTLFFSGEKGKSLVNKWSDIVTQHEDITNETLSLERTDFVVHRHEQSVFSLLFKTQGFFEERCIIPYPRNNYFSMLRSLRFPIWWARNRTGETIVPFSIRIINRLLV